MKKEKGWEKKFIGKFLLLFGIPYLFIKIFTIRELVYLIADIEEKLLNATGLSVQRTGDLLFSSKISYQIVMDCTGVVMCFMLIALLYATEIKKEEKKKALLYYIPFLLLFNIARLYLTLASGIAYGLQAMEPVHFLLWFVDAGLVVYLWSRAAGINIPEILLKG